jgi:hypothetical protein
VKPIVGPDSSPDSRGEAGAAAAQLLVAASLRWTERPAQATPSRVRELLIVSYGGLLDEADTEDIAMTAHELLENVIKYSDAGESGFEIEVCNTGGHAQARIRTHNAAAPQRAEQLEGVVKRIVQAEDPMALYDELICASVDSVGSGLGLARIRAEAGMSLRCSVDAGYVAIVAERIVSLRRAPSVGETP